MLLGIITYTFLSDLNTFLSDLIKFLRIVSHILIALAYENPELFHLICVLSVLSVLGIFSVVLLIVNIYKISRRLVDFFFLLKVFGQIDLDKITKFITQKCIV
jgi:hypothetical protein